MTKEKIHITIGTPHRRDFTPEYVESLAETLKTARYNYTYLLYTGPYINQNRNRITQIAEGDYLLFIDTDMAWTSRDIENLVETNKDIVGGLYYTKTSQPLPLVVNYNNGRIAQITPIPDEPFPCDAIGTGFLLIKKRVIETFFNHSIFPFEPIMISEVVVDAEYNPAVVASPDYYPSLFLPEDFSFCWQAKQLGFEIWCNPQVKVGHIGPYAFMDSEAAARWLRERNWRKLAIWESCEWGEQREFDRKNYDKLFDENTQTFRLQQRE